MELDISEEVLKLVGTVGRLPRDDQTRILKIVDLLSVASFPVQRRTQRMLSDLLSSPPKSKSACVAGVDEVIEYLEHAVYGNEEPAWPTLDDYPLSGSA